MAGNDKTEAGSFEYTGTRHRGPDYIGKHNERTPLISHYSRQIDNVSQTRCSNLDIVLSAKTRKKKLLRTFYVHLKPQYCHNNRLLQFSK